MTLPYSQFPLQRALTGIQAAGYRYVAWGTTHNEPGGPQMPVMAPDAPPEKARELGQALPRPGPGAADDVLHDLSRGTQAAWKS